MAFVMNSSELIMFHLNFDISAGGCAACFFFFGALTLLLASVVALAATCFRSTRGLDRLCVGRVCTEQRCRPGKM